jgi:hypothetical protein
MSLRLETSAANSHEKTMYLIRLDSFLHKNYLRKPFFACIFVHMKTPSKFEAICKFEDGFEGSLVEGI